MGEQCRSQERLTEIFFTFKLAGLKVAALGLSCCRSRAPEHRLSSCGTWVQLPHGTWDLPGPGIEPVSPALAGRFFTTEPPRKPPPRFLLYGSNIMYRLCPATYVHVQMSLGVACLLHTEWT